MFPFRLKSSYSLAFILFAEGISFLIWGKTGSYSSCIVFLALSSFLILDVITLFVNCLLMKKVNIKRCVHDRFIEGDNIKVRLTVRNTSFLPLINIEVNDYLPWVEGSGRITLFSVWLKGGGFLEKEYSNICPYRGKYTLKKVNLTIKGVIGVIFIEKDIYINNTIYVYPQTFLLTKVPPLVKGYLPWFGLDTISAGGDEDEFFGLREYKRGDSLKRIHWFSVARKNKLVVKEFQKCAFYQASILFVLHESYKDGKLKDNVVEYIIRTAASLTRYFIENNICVELLAHAGKLAVFYPSNKGGEYMDELFEFYAEAQAESHITLKDFFSEYYNLLPSRSTIFVLITEKDTEYIKGFLHLKDKDIDIIAIVFMTYTFSYDLQEHEILTLKERVISEFSSLGIKAFACARGDNLEHLFFSAR